MSGHPVPRLRPSLFLAARFQLSAEDSQPEVFLTLSAVLSSLVLPLVLLVVAHVLSSHTEIDNRMSLLLPASA